MLVWIFWWGGGVSEWQPIETAPENEVVATKIEDALGTRNWQLLIRKGRLWFLPDESMYVYYTPTHWKPMPEHQEGF
jgi:hypothetical protein